LRLSDQLFRDVGAVYKTRKMKYTSNNCIMAALTCFLLHKGFYI